MQHLKDFPANIYHEFRDGKDGKKQELVLFLHGFPGRTTKNEDISLKLNAMGYSTCLFHYQGLGKSAGVFSFKNCIELSESILKSLSQRFSKVHLLGHSWGGFVAAVIYWQIHNPGNLFLLNPLTYILPDSQVLELVKSAINKHELPEDYLNNKNMVTQLNNELNCLRQNFDFKNQLANFVKSDLKQYIKIYLATVDPLTPPELCIKICKDVGIDYQQFSSDHWFTQNREQVLTAIYKDLG
ncbi:MAG: alpha/beta hydrolase [Bdellovibrionales bacterium]|nr:alpha/beta hydrolase [Bdellovibrionales bacterium]